MKNKYVGVWNGLHKNFVQTNKVKYDDWLDDLEQIILNTNCEIIDLGCGVTGNNTRYLLEKGKSVISCDFADEAIKVVSQFKGSKTLLFDMLEKFPFKDDFTDLVIADLSLHYFNEKDTFKIISEINRVLKSGGYLFFRVNSTNSEEFINLVKENVEEIEPNLFYTKNMEKRFFSKTDIEHFFNGWRFISIVEEDMTRFGTNKIVWKCVVQKK
ncbi:MAG: class I SAM-dependent methyltransferase [Clostridia bacterium]|nr:class I SAM-dependent methyltransferase [Clostridia bacterium]